MLYGAKTDFFAGKPSGARMGTNAITPHAREEVQTTNTVQKVLQDAIYGLCSADVSVDDNSAYHFLPAWSPAVLTCKCTWQPLGWHILIRMILISS